MRAGPIAIKSQPQAGQQFIGKRFIHLDCVLYAATVEINHANSNWWIQTFKSLKLIRLTGNISVICNTNTALNHLNECTKRSNVCFMYETDKSTIVIYLYNVHRFPFPFKCPNASFWCHTAYFELFTDDDKNKPFIHVTLEWFWSHFTRFHIGSVCLATWLHYINGFEWFKTRIFGIVFRSTEIQHISECLSTVSMWQFIYFDFIYLELNCQLVNYRNIRHYISLRGRFECFVDSFLKRNKQSIIFRKHYDIGRCNNLHYSNFVGVSSWIIQRPWKEYINFIGCSNQCRRNRIQFGQIHSWALVAIGSWRMTWPYSIPEAPTQTPLDALKRQNFDFHPTLRFNKPLKRLDFDLDSEGRELLSTGLVCCHFEFNECSSVPRAVLSIRLASITPTTLRLVIASYTYYWRNAFFKCRKYFWCLHIL